MNSGGTSRTSVMIANSQLAQLNNPGMQPCSATTVEHACARCQDQTGALRMFCVAKESESCLVKAPAKHASESVPVVGELLCTGVQTNTERHTRKETREMCSCSGIQTTMGTTSRHKAWRRNEKNQATEKQKRPDAHVARCWRVPPIAKAKSRRRGCRPSRISQKNCRGQNSYPIQFFHSPGGDLCFCKLDAQNVVKFFFYEKKRNVSA